MNTTTAIRFIPILFICMLIQPLNAQTGLDSLTHKTHTSKLEASADYLVPTRFNNQITTTTLNCFFWKKKFTKNYILASVGLTGTYAWGRSEQIQYPTDSTTEIRIYKTAAFGIGPVLQIEHTIVKFGRFSLAGEASGGVIIYNHRFPYGGDYYNIMFRMGTSISYGISKNCYFKTGYRWMHVSNGKGFGNQNPFYEAQGFSLGIVKII